MGNVDMGIALHQMYIGAVVLQAGNVVEIIDASNIFLIVFMFTA